eukprot:TRINITY_DN17928_c0_g1_i1.p2 TRINITY_DN17928_c0_g1~~TRINITY_DN17928_c0_g1_i1.p2  ORF type:complete len:226 (-),score=57.16 TRINITY_DN17928_c0_g1_i1:110-787(-)
MQHLKECPMDYGVSWRPARLQMAVTTNDHLKEHRTARSYMRTGDCEPQAPRGMEETIRAAVRSRCWPTKQQASTAALFNGGFEEWKQTVRHSPGASVLFGVDGGGGGSGGLGTARTAATMSASAGSLPGLRGSAQGSATARGSQPSTARGGPSTARGGPPTSRGGLLSAGGSAAVPPLPLSTLAVPLSGRSLPRGSSGAGSPSSSWASSVPRSQSVSGFPGHAGR